MMTLRPPTNADIAALIARERDAAFTYPEVGATGRDPLPSGYAHDVYGTVIGGGEACFERAAAALARFANYPRPWTRIHADATPREGLVFVAQIAHFGFHSLNGCRVIAVVDDQAPIRRYGFAFGTLPSHEERGEERFVVSFDPATNQVRYDVRAFSRPRGRLARIGAPIARALQARFQRETCEAMRVAASPR